MGRTETTPIDVDFLQVKLDNPRFRTVRQSLADVGFPDATSLLATYAGSAQDLAPWLEGASVNLDRNLRLQYLAGLGLNRFDSAPIYRDMLGYARFPEWLFEAAPSTLDRLRTAVTGAIERQRELDDY